MSAPTTNSSPTAVFELDHGKLAADRRFAALADGLRKHARIDSRESFNAYCRDACRLWDDRFDDGVGETSAKFTELLGEISQHGANVISTSWGGVVVTLHEPPRVEKFLVVRNGGYLALEKHEQKDEHLDVREGAGLILWRSAPDRPLTVEALCAGDQHHFEPGMEHCIIGTEDLLVFERSTDPKGMDQDLVFIYLPD